MKHSFLGTTVHNRQEVFMLVFTALQAFFIGGFSSLFSIGAHVLFLQSWQPSSIPLAYILSGAWGIILFSIYSMLTSRTKLAVFTFSSLFLVFILNLALFLNYDSIVNYQISGVPMMFPFVLAIPLAFLVLVLFRRSIRSIFTPDQHRRLYPLIRSCLMAGIILSSYFLVGSLYINWDILLILASSAAFIGIATVLQFPVNLLHSIPCKFASVTKRTNLLRSKFYELLYTRYTFLLLLFVLISALTGFILHYHFVVHTQANYTHTIGLAKFFGFFTGTMFLFVYIIEKFLVRKILYSYDSPFSLVLIPAVLALAALVAVIIDLLFGTSTVIARFSFGFLIIAMLRIGYETAFEAIELPSLRASDL